VKSWLAELSNDQVRSSDEFFFFYLDKNYHVRCQEYQTLETAHNTAAFSLTMAPTPILVTAEEQREIRSVNCVQQSGDRKRKAAVALEQQRMTENGLSADELLASACPEARLAAAAVARGLVEQDGAFNDDAVALSICHSNQCQQKRNHTKFG